MVGGHAGENSVALIIFRTDASLEIGIGHVMRCLTLADALSEKGCECQFICRIHEGNLIELIRSKGYSTHVLPIRTDTTKRTHMFHQVADDYSSWLGVTQDQDAKDCAQILVERRPDWLVVDHYALDAQWESIMAPSCHKLMVIDDLANRPHNCDLLLDQSLGREEDDYRSKVPNTCRLLCGSQFALLRAEFAVLRPYSLQRRCQPRMHQLLITMGGVDASNVTGMVLRVIRDCPLPLDCQIKVVMGTTAPWLDEIRKQSHEMPWSTQVLVGVSDMAQLMAESDLAIGAAGSTSWELCCMGVPSLLVCTADNQRTVIEALASVNAIMKVDRAALGQSDGKKFFAQYSKLSKKLSEYSRAASLVTDGYGAIRVSADLMSSL